MHHGSYWYAPRLLLVYSGAAGGTVRTCSPAAAGVKPQASVLRRSVARSRLLESRIARRAHSRAPFERRSAHPDMPSTGLRIWVTSEVCI